MQALPPDEARYLQLLQDSLSPDAAVRNPATRTLMNETGPAVTLTKYNLALRDCVPLNSRLAALVMVKNDVAASSWTCPPELEETFRQTITLAAIAAYDTELAKTFYGIFEQMCFKLFPDNFPQAFQVAVAAFQEDDERRVAASLPILRTIWKTARFLTMADDRPAIIEGMCELFYPRAVSLLVTIASSATLTASSAYIARWILKCFQIRGASNFPDCFTRVECGSVCGMWQMFVGTFPTLLTVPAGGTDARLNTDVFRLRKRVCELLRMYCGSMFTTKRIESKTVESIDDRMRDALRVSATASIASMVQIIQLARASEPPILSDRQIATVLWAAHNLIVRLEPCYNVLIPVEGDVGAAIQMLVRDVLVPLLSLTAVERHEFVTDPREFTISSVGDAEKEAMSARSATETLFRTLVRGDASRFMKKRTKADPTLVSRNALIVLHGGIEAFLAAPGEPATALFAEGCVYALETILELIVATTVGSATLLPLVRGIAQLLSSGVPIVQYRAASLLGFAVPFVRDWDGLMDVLREALIALIGCGGEASPLPVRVQCALAFKSLLDVSACRALLSDHAVELASLFLSLLAQVPVEDLSACVNTVVGAYPQSLGPHLPELATNLIATFDASSAMAMADVKEDDDAAEARQEIAQHTSIDLLKALLMVVMAARQTIAQLPVIEDIGCALVARIMGVGPNAAGVVDDAKVMYLPEAMKLLAELVYNHILIASGGLRHLYQPCELPPKLHYLLYVLLQIAVTENKASEETRRRLEEQGALTDNVVIVNGCDEASHFVTVFDNYISANVSQFLTGLPVASYGNDPSFCALVGALGTPMDAMLVFMTNLCTTKTLRHVDVVPKLAEVVLHYALQLGPAVFPSLPVWGPFIRLLATLQLRILPPGSSVTQLCWNAIADAFHLNAGAVLDALRAPEAADVSTQPGPQDVVLLQEWSAFLQAEFGPPRPLAARGTPLERDEKWAEDRGFDRKMAALGLLGLLEHLATVPALPAPFTPDAVAALASIATAQVIACHIVQASGDQLASEYDEDEDGLSSGDEAQGDEPLNLSDPSIQAQIKQHVTYVCRLLSAVCCLPRPPLPMDEMLSAGLLEPGQAELRAPGATITLGSGAPPSDDTSLKDTVSSESASFLSPVSDLSEAIVYNAFATRMAEAGSTVRVGW